MPLETNLDLKTNCSCWHVSLFSYSVEWAFLQIKLSCSLSETSADLGFMLPSIRQWCLFLRHSPLVFPHAFHKGWAQLCRKILIFPETGKNWPKCCQSRDLKICWKFWPLAFAEDSMFFRKIFCNIRTGDAWINPFQCFLVFYSICCRILERMEINENNDMKWVIRILPKKGMQAKVALTGTSLSFILA